MENKKTGPGRWDWLDELMDAQQGKVSCVCRNLVTGETYVKNPDLVHPSASVIKMFLMAYVFQLEEDSPSRSRSRLIRPSWPSPAASCIT